MALSQGVTPRACSSELLLLQKPARLRVCPPKMCWAGLVAEAGAPCVPFAPLGARCGLCSAQIRSGTLRQTVFVHAAFFFFLACLDTHWYIHGTQAVT